MKDESCHSIIKIIQLEKFVYYLHLHNLNRYSTFKNFNISIKLNKKRPSSNGTHISRIPFFSPVIHINYFIAFKINFVGKTH